MDGEGGVEGHRAHRWVNKGMSQFVRLHTLCQCVCVCVCADVYVCTDLCPVSKSACECSVCVCMTTHMLCCESSHRWTAANTQQTSFILMSQIYTMKI